MGVKKRIGGKATYIRNDGTSKGQESLDNFRPNQKDSFFGEVERVSNKYFKFQHFHDDDNITIVTSNIKQIKGNYVMIVGENQAVYLKDWSILPIHDYDMGANTYAVKLKRQYFKPYTFKTPFSEFGISGSETFDDFVALSKNQDKNRIKYARGHMGGD